MKKINILEWEKEIRKNIVAKGEEESAGTFRFWLDNLNGVCDIAGHTDVMSVIACHTLSGEEAVSVQVNTPDDNSTLFVGLDELPYKVVKKILNQVSKPLV